MRNSPANALQDCGLNAFESGRLVTKNQFLANLLKHECNQRLVVIFTL
jgi:hypothetical protein